MTDTNKLDIPPDIYRYITEMNKLVTSMTNYVERVSEAMLATKNVIDSFDNRLSILEARAEREDFIKTINKKDMR